MFAKKIGELGGSRQGGHIRLGISQDPLAGRVVELDPGVHNPQQDHVARVARQLLWGVGYWYNQGVLSPFGALVGPNT